MSTCDIMLRGNTVTATVAGLPRWSLDHGDEDAARRTCQWLTALAEVLATFERAAFTDRLTGLPNRAALDVELVRRQRLGERYAVLLADLDGFKPVNDMFGHDAGDEVLAAVARRLGTLAGFAARLGGDEFVLLTATRAAYRTGWAAHRAVAEPVRLCDAQEVVVGASVGVAYVEPGVPAGGVLRQADEAMYQAKAGRPSVVVYTGRVRGVGSPRPTPRTRDMHHLLESVGLVGAGQGVAR
jgi:diguanylate cyclase (GGDEF)-like protein